MSAADVMLFESFESSLSQDAALLDKFPKIKACRQKVQDCKKMKEYLAKRKQTPFWAHDLVILSWILNQENYSEGAFWRGFV